MLHGEICRAAQKNQDQLSVIPTQLWSAHSGQGLLFLCQIVKEY
jgi:hypothetical protein